MISGSIKTHEEPEKPKKFSYEGNTRNWGWMYEQWDTPNIETSPEYWKNKDNQLLAVLNEGTKKGLTQNARVRRTSGTAGYGTIVHIHRTYTMAWNSTNQQLEPFKVCWDKTNLFQGGTFDYCVDDLTPADPKQIPVLFVVPQKETHHENVPGAC